MEPAQTFAKNLLKLPTAVPAIVSNLQKLSTYHEKVEDRRDRLAPLAYHTYDNFKYKTTWSVKAHTWVDPDMPLSKKVSDGALPGTTHHLQQVAYQFPVLGRSSTNTAGCERIWRSCSLQRALSYLAHLASFLLQVWTW